MAFLLTVMPDELLALLVLALGVGAAFGFVRSRAFWGFTGSVLLLLIAGPLIGAVVEGLPSGWQLIILLAVTVVFIRTLLAFLLGRGASDRLVAHLAYDLIVLPFRALGAIVRGVLAARRAQRWR